VVKLKRYFLHTTSTYVFEAESDDEAIRMVEEDMEAIEDGIEGEELTDIISFDNPDHKLRTVKDYR